MPKLGYERSAAKREGKTRYFTGRPCSNGHIAERSTANGSCIVCQNNAYLKFKQNNLEKLRKKYRDVYWNNHERSLLAAKKYRDTHSEKVKQINRDAKKKFRAYHTSLENLRRAKKLLATPKWLTKEHHKKIEDHFVLAKKLSEMSGIKMAVDHIVPLQGKTVCGLHVPWNLQIISKEDNSKKRNHITDAAYWHQQQYCLTSGKALPWNWR